MKVIIPLAGFGRHMRPHTWSRPKPLLHVAGHTIIGHLLDRLAPVTTEEVIFVVDDKGAEIEAWIRHHYPHLDSHFVTQEKALGQAHALWLCRSFLTEGELLIAFGDAIVDADYEAINDTGADAVYLVPEMEAPHEGSAGVFWVRNGRLLRNSLEASQQANLTDRTLHQQLLHDKLSLEAKPCHYAFDTNSPEQLLHTNARLLGIGFQSEDLIERSYVEDFTAMPPAFLHETAQVDAAVIGPYASIGPNVTIKNAIVRNSIIDEGAIIENCVLDGCLIGQRAQIRGQSLRLFIGDDSNFNS